MNVNTMKKYLIIPPCSDFNRGDQALVWETARFAEDAGYKGEFYFMAEAMEPVEQSVKHGLKSMVPILDHPSKRFKSKENIKLDWKLIMKWGSVSLMDLTWSLLLLTPLRILVVPFLSKDKKISYNLFTEADAIFVKGGGFVHSYGGKTALYYIYFQLYHIFLAQSLGKDVYICPNSFGPFEGLGVKMLVRRAFRKSKIVTAREIRSSMMCKKDLQMDIPAYPDFGFFLPNAENGKKKCFFAAHNFPTDRKSVAITARPHRFPHSDDPEKAYKDFIRSMRDFALWLYKEGYFPVFIEHVYAINNHENDSYCIKDIINGMPKGVYGYFSDRTLNCHQLKSIYGYFDYIVGTRFHSMIFSMSNMVPGIAITYVGNKGEGIMEDMGMGDYFIPIGEVTSESLKEKFDFLVRTEDVAKDKIKSFLDSADKKRKELVDLIRRK